MKIKGLGEKIKLRDGTPLKDSVGEMDYANLIVKALDCVTDQKMNQDEMYTRHRIADKVNGKNEVELTAEDIVKIKSALAEICKVLSPMHATYLYGTAIKKLEG